MFLTLLTALFIFFEVALSGAVCYLKLFNWFSVGLFYVDWGFLFDSLTATMLIVITSISFLVHMYAIEYMRGDPFVARFMAYLSLFTWFMIILVTADNLVQLFVGWEGVGLVSYLLINFWFTIPEANKSALKAMVVNRVGDLGLAIAIAITYKLFKSIKFTVFLPLVPFFSKEVIIFFGYSCKETWCLELPLIGSVCSVFTAVSRDVFGTDTSFPGSTLVLWESRGCSEETKGGVWSPDE